MKAVNFNEYITKLFMAGAYYWFTGEDRAAHTCWDTAVIVLKSATVVMVS